METELRLSLLVIGVCFIVGIVLHGMWKIRQVETDKKRTSDRIEPRADIEDDCDVGPVRIVPKQDLPQETSIREETDVVVDDAQKRANEPSDVPTELVSSATPEKENKLYGSVVTHPKPHIQVKVSETKEVKENNADDAGIPPPPGFLLKQEIPQVSSAVAAPTEAVTKPETTSPMKKRPSRVARKEPTLNDDQLRIDFDDNPGANTSHNIEQEVLVINVRASEEQPISGAALLPLLLTLGFKFGDQDIFHRHVNANGKGPVLFSLANMFKPGVFDIDNLETFQTKGVSLFMILPIEGDAHQVFNMMHNAARKLAEEFSAQVLDGRRSVLTKQGLQQYAEKIREFERKRIVARHANH